MRATIWMILLAGCTETSVTPDAASALPADAGRCAPDAAAPTEFSLENLWSVTVVEKVPAEIRRGENTWTLRVHDDQGAPVSNAQVALRPFMPEHGHATNPPEFVGRSLASGDHEVGPFNLFMPGLWELTLRVDADTSVVIPVCLEG